MLVLTADQASNLIFRGQFADGKLIPQPLTDGRYVLPETVLTDPRHAAYRHLLRAGSIEPITGLTIELRPEFRYFLIPVNGKTMYLSSAPQPHSFGQPTPGMFRFECRQNESGYSGDIANRNRRVELVDENTVWRSGDVVWESWCTVIGSQRAGFDRTSPYSFAIFHQWHSVDTNVSRSPVFRQMAEGGREIIATRSDRLGINTDEVHYNQPLPASGVPTYWVVRAVLGQNGHLDVWRNGVQIVNTNVSIGYYNDDGGTRGLAYPHWGSYMRNTSTVDVVYHGNMEWGAANLSARAATPKPITAPAGGWI